MNWAVVFYNDRVESEIAKMPPGFVARFVRYAERMEIYGPDLGMPHTKAMGAGLFKLRLKTGEGVVSIFIVRESVEKLLCFIISSKRRTRHRRKNYWSLEHE